MLNAPQERRPLRKSGISFDSDEIRMPNSNQKVAMMGQSKSGREKKERKKEREGGNNRINHWAFDAKKWCDVKLAFHYH